MSNILTVCFSDQSVINALKPFGKEGMNVVHRMAFSPVIINEAPSVQTFQMNNPVYADRLEEIFIKNRIPYQRDGETFRANISSLEELYSVIVPVEDFGTCMDKPTGHEVDNQKIRSYIKEQYGISIYNREVTAAKIALGLPVDDYSYTFCGVEHKRMVIDALLFYRVIEPYYS